jgi:hypothetical protein
MTCQEEYEKIPERFEVLIEGVQRVKWLVTRYLKRPPKLIRARDEIFDDLLCDPEGYVWGLVIPNSEPGVFKPPYLKRCTSYLVGEDNLEVKQPIL